MIDTNVDIEFSIFGSKTTYLITHDTETYENSIFTYNQTVRSLIYYFLEDVDMVFDKKESLISKLMRQV